MVVGITLATIAFLRTRGGSGEVTIFQPEALRPALEKQVADREARERCLEICDELQLRTDAYDEQVAATLAAYLSSVEDYGTTASELGAHFDALADAREATLLACLDARARMLASLDEASWRAVFGKSK
jgi:hypothetical protein